MGILDQILQQQLQGGQRGGVRAPQVGLANPGQIQAPPLGGVAPAARAAQQAPGGGFGAGFTTAFNQSANRAGVASENALQREAAEDLMLQRQAQMNQRETNRIAASTAAAKLKFGRDQQLADARVKADNAAFQRDLGKPRNVGPDTNVVQRNPQTGEFETVYEGRDLTVPGESEGLTQEQEKRAEVRAKRFGKSGESADKAYDTLASNQQLEAAFTNPNMYSGPLGGFIGSAKDIGKSFLGLKSIKGSTDAQIVKKINQKVLFQAVLDGGRGFSDSDKEFGREAQIGLHTNRAAAKIMIGMSNRRANRDIAIKDAKDNWLDDPRNKGSLKGFSGQVGRKIQEDYVAATRLDINNLRNEALRTKQPGPLSGLNFNLKKTGVQKLDNGGTLEIIP